MNKDKIFLLYFGEKQLENVEHLKYLGSLINDARCKSEIRSSITMVKVKQPRYRPGVAQRVPGS
jgi:hypothetical protein